MQSRSAPPSTRIRVRRHPERGVYDAASVHAILDEAMIAHVGFIDAETPVVIPTAFGRDGDHVYLHGSAVALWAKKMAEGGPVCVTVTLVDGLVLARSTFKHSMNYRSVVIFGKASLVTEHDEKMHGLECIVEHLVPGRSREAREPNDKELAATSVLKLSLAEASAKIRNGGPIDDEADFARPVWAGVLPAAIAYGTPIPDASVPPIVGIPDYIGEYRR